MTNLEDSWMSVALGVEAHGRAKQFAAEQRDPQKGKRVYLNTLSVYAVHQYLGWLGIETDLSQSDSWQSEQRVTTEAADLVVPGLGKLECCVLLPGERAYQLPEIPEERLGYVGVQFGQELDKVELIGFAPALNLNDPPETLEFGPLDGLVDYLARLREGLAVVQQETAEDERVREILANRSLAEIVAELERVYRELPPVRWRYAGANALMGSAALVGDREQRPVAEATELQELAERLLQKLKQAWNEEG